MSVLHQVYITCADFYNDQHFDSLARQLIAQYTPSNYMNLLRYTRQKTNLNVSLVDPKNTIFFDSDLHFHHPLIRSVSDVPHIQEALFYVYNGFKPLPQRNKEFVEDMRSKMFFTRSGKKSPQYNDPHDYIQVAKVSDHYQSVYVINVSNVNNSLPPPEPQPLSPVIKKPQKSRSRRSRAELLRFPLFGHCHHYPKDRCEEETYYFGEDCYLDANFA